MTGFKLVQDNQKVVYYQKRKTSTQPAPDDAEDAEENKTPAQKENKKTE